MPTNREISSLEAFILAMTLMIGIGVTVAPELSKISKLLSFAAIFTILIGTFVYFHPRGPRADE